MNEEKIINGYYQSNIKTSRNEDSVYAMKYASQQMLIDKLQQENARLKDNWNKLNNWLEEQVKYLTEIDGQNIPLNDNFKFCSMNELYQTGKYSGFKETLEKIEVILKEN